MRKGTKYRQRREAARARQHCACQTGKCVYIFIRHFDGEREGDRQVHILVVRGKIFWDDNMFEKSEIPFPRQINLGIVIPILTICP